MGGGSRKRRSDKKRKDGGGRRSGADTNGVALNTNEPDVLGDDGMDKLVEMSLEDIQRMIEADVLGDDGKDKLAEMSLEDIERMLVNELRVKDNEIRVTKDEVQKLTLEHDAVKEKVEEKEEKIKEETKEKIKKKIKEKTKERTKGKNKEQLDGNVVEIVDMLENSGASADPFLDGQAHGGFAKATDNLVKEVVPAHVHEFLKAAGFRIHGTAERACSRNGTASSHVGISVVLGLAILIFLISLSYTFR